MEDLIIWCARVEPFKQVWTQDVIFDLHTWSKFTFRVHQYKKEKKKIHPNWKYKYRRNIFELKSGGIQTQSVY